MKILPLFWCLIFSIFIIALNCCQFGEAQLIPKKIDSPLKNHTDNLINNLTLGTMELSPESNFSNGSKGKDFISKAGIIILNNGTKLSGYITPHEFGYRMNYNNGSQIIPFEYVFCTGSSMEEIYNKLKQEHPQPTLADHIRLAKQCHQWGHQEGAIEQIKLAILKDENHPEIKQLAEHYFPKNSAQAIEQASFNKTETRNVPREIEKYREANHLNEMKSHKLPPLPGLDYVQSREFSSSIQPILQAKCGNARCHGGMATQEFHVAWISRDQPISRKRLEDNLRSLLAQVNREHVSESRIILQTTMNDGVHGSSLWKDELSLKNQVTLFEFVYSLERPSKQTSEGNTISSPKLQKIPPEEMPLLKQVPTNTGTLIQEKEIIQASGKSTEPSQANNESWERFQKSRAHDAFDPEIFNQK